MRPTRVGFARVSRKDQRQEPQCDALFADSCEKVFEEKISGREAERGALGEASDYPREGDILGGDRSLAAPVVCAAATWLPEISNLCTIRGRLWRPGVHR
jgi:hypothetical protein